MALDHRKLCMAFRALRKSLGTLSKEPSVEEIHDLRTRSRRVETIIHALSIDRKGGGPRLLRAVESIRRKSGKVRDLDVLTGYMASIQSYADQEYSAQLLNHLAEQRWRLARKLCRAVAKSGNDIRRDLRQCSFRIDRKIGSSKGGLNKVNKWRVNAAASALRLLKSLAGRRDLKSGNLHSYRLNLKSLIYLLQLIDHPNAAFLEALRKAKDVIGEWHDWSELESTANSLLDRNAARTISGQIHSIASQKLTQALSITKQMQKQWLDGAGGRGGKADSHHSQLKESLLTSAVLSIVA
ncbi:MAG: CHAD domain-containing protein [Terracidiphilus sp.]|jgi:CHAD domain-containing protein